MKNPRGIPENAQKGLQAIPVDCWFLHAVIGIQINQPFPVIVAGDPNLFASLNLIGANDRAKVLKFATFRDYGWGHVVVYLG